MRVLQLYCVFWFEAGSLRELIFTDEAAARAFVAARGRSFEPTSGTLSRFVDLVWLPEQATRLSRRVLRRYAYLLNGGPLRVLGERPLRELTTSDIVDYLERRRAAGRGVSYLGHELACLRSIFQLAASLGLAGVPVP